MWAGGGSIALSVVLANDRGARCHEVSAGGLCHILLYKLRSVKKLNRAMSRDVVG
jgi:hypothetical protein